MRNNEEPRSFKFSLGKLEKGSSYVNADLDVTGHLLMYAFFHRPQTSLLEFLFCTPRLLVQEKIDLSH